MLRKEHYFLLNYKIKHIMAPDKIKMRHSGAQNFGAHPTPSLTNSRISANDQLVGEVLTGDDI